MWLDCAAHGVGGGFGDGHELSLSKLAARPCHCGEKKTWLLIAGGGVGIDISDAPAHARCPPLPGLSKLSRPLLSAMQNKDTSSELFATLGLLEKI